MMHRPGGITSRPPPGATADYQGPEQPSGQPSRMAVTLVSGSGPTPTAEAQALLRKRLRFLGLRGSSISCARCAPRCEKRLVQPGGGGVLPPDGPTALCPRHGDAGDRGTPVRAGPCPGPPPARGAGKTPGGHSEVSGEGTDPAVSECGRPGQGTGAMRTRAGPPRPGRARRAGLSLRKRGGGTPARSPGA